MFFADVPSSLLLLDLRLLPVCKEEVCPDHEEQSSSLVQEEPQPPQIKEERGEELLGRPEEAEGSTMAIQISKVWSYAPSGKNFIDTDVKTLMFWFWHRLLENFS